MAFTFDGANKRVILSSGTTSIDLADLWSRWKDWLLAGNAGYARAFDTVGGEPIDPVAGTQVPLYLFLFNGWKIRPQEASHTLNVTGGILLVSGGGDPFVNTTGSYTVRINYQQPVQAIGYSTGGGTGGLTEEQAAQLAELWRLAGLDQAAPLAVTATQRTAGAIQQGIVEAGGTVTVTRQ